MSDRCDAANHSFDLHRERDLLWCAKCGTTKRLTEPDDVKLVIEIGGSAGMIAAANAALAHEKSGRAGRAS